jgi:hypothetical protein
VRRWAWALALGACATTPVNGAPPRCSGSSTTGCLTREVCSYDAAGGCMMCQCESAYGPSNPAGMPPSQVPRP